MPSKLQNILELYSQTLTDISRSPENWASFLISASSNYKYNFDEQVLIFVQKPDAIACADIDIWNKKLRRWVNKGAKGIALVEYNNGSSRLRHVFDVSDTHDKYNRKINLWKIDEKYKDEIIENLEARFGELENKSDLAQAIISASYNSVEDNLQDYLTDLISIKHDSFLEELDDFNVEVELRTLLSNSVAFMTLQRCDINPFEYFSLEDFRAIVDFNSYDTISRLGAATSDIAETNLREISTTIRKLQLDEKNKNRTFVKSEKIDDNVINKENERRDSNEFNIYTSGGLQSTRLNVADTKQEREFREIFSNEIKLSKETQERAIYSIENEELADRTFARDREDSYEESRDDNERDEKQREDNGRIKSARPNEMGWIDEQHQEFSGGDSDSRINIQLEKLPSVEEQLNIINEVEESDNSSTFSFTQEMIDRTLQNGSGFEEGKFRIYEQFEKSLSSKENIDFLKHEYGIGGSSAAYVGADFGQDHDSKGIRLYKGFKDYRPELLLAWNKVEERISELIKLDRYLTPKEKEDYFNWISKKEDVNVIMFDNTNFNKNYKLSNGDYFHVHPNEEGYYYAIYDRHGFETDGGLLEYSDNEENQTLKDIRDRLAEFTGIDELSNDNLEEVSQEYIDRLENHEELDEAAEKIIEQIVNDAINQIESEKLKNKEYIFRLGDSVYIGQEQYEIVSIGNTQVQLSDPRYPLFGREISKEEFERKIKENPLNDHLLKENRIDEISEELISENNDVLETSEEIDIIENNIEFIKEKPKEKSRITEYNLHPEIAIEERNQYKIYDDNLGVGSLREKFARNIDAIKVLKKCEEENRYANKEEQEILSKYVGWGGLAKAFDENDSNWTREYYILKELLIEEEYKEARASTLTAFYTPPIVIRSMYKALENMGVKQANILEPSCGIGNFFGMIPEEMKDSKIYGVELDSITGRIAQQLYQKSNIAVKGYEKVDMPDSFFDIAIGNVPFGDFKVSDRRYDKNKFLIHDYFFAKTLDKVRPGGIVAFITSKGTLDKENPTVRKYIAQRAELLGAIRLPDDTFSKNAGTEVTSDIIFLQKRENMTDIMPDWVYLDKDSNGITMNKYFVDNPDMILGDMVMESTQYGMNSTCKARTEISFEEQLNFAITNIHGEIQEYDIEDLEDDDKSIIADPEVKNFSYTIKDGTIYFRENSRMYPQDLPVTTLNRIKGMIELRECVNNLIEMQTEDYPDENIKLEQQRLNRLYDEFSKKYGLINSRGNNTAFSNDSSYFLLCSLEVLDNDGNFVRKADMFNKRTIKANKIITQVDTSNEALIVSLTEKAKVDLDYMSELTGKDIKEIVEELQGVIYKVPMENDKYVTADEYLSGNVREKLKLAEAILETNPEFQINVDSLRKVVPKDLNASEIGIELGATWIPTDVIKQFMFELLDTPNYARWEIKVRYSEYNSEWYVEKKSYDSTNIKAYRTYGTDRINAYKIIEQTLNLKDVKIFDTIIEADGSKTRVLNKKETAIAQAKQDEIKSAFKDWIWKNQERRERLEELYNEKFNSIRPREYDGSNLNFVGMNPEIKLRKHQVDAIAHILYGGNTLLAHEVGAGKTFEMVAAAMESKRLGLCNKSLFVVPNHIIEQFASEFLQLYPSANILVATKKDFATNNRKKFCSRIATGEYDAVIIGHSQFEKIPISIERQKYALEKQISEILMGIDEVKRDRGENFTIKQLEKTRKKLEEKLEKLNNQDRKDDVITFEQLGVDKLFVDEAHNFKNLFLYTKMRNVGGIAQTEAQKSSDLFMKCRYLDEITEGKGTVFATGTPVSNSMVELYTMQRYLQYKDLTDMKLQQFDNWASTFGEKVTAIELSPEGSGYRSKTRFARFHNLPELMALFKEIADIQTTDTLNLPTPDAIFHNVVVQASEIQKDMVNELGERAERIRNGMVDARDDNMLKITNEGRKLALDQRMMNPLLEDNKASKVNECSNNIYRIWEESKIEKATQLVFCDLSTPKSLGTEDNPYEMELVDGIYKLKEREFTDVYIDLKRKLIEKGIPENEIAFIHDADNEVKKKELFGKVRKGDVRVLIGSTSKMGAGTNVQDKLIALHHLDCPWRPADLTQRNGRGIRQGNKNKEVHIYTYVTEGTFDAYMFQLVESKQKFISQIMTSKTPMRTAEDIDEKALSYGEIKALATGNPEILEKTQLDSEVAKLKLLKTNHLSQIYDIENRIAKYYPNEINRLTEKINAMEKDVETLKEKTQLNADGFSKMIIKNVEYFEKEAAGKAILEACKNKTNAELETIGEYRGFKLELAFDRINKVFTMNIKNNYSYEINLGSDAYGNIQRIDNALEKINDLIPNVRDRLANEKEQLENAKLEAQKVFPKEDELREKMKRLEELNISLKINDNEKELFGNDDEEEKENQMCKKDRER